jgi:hypothetical protein
MKTKIFLLAGLTTMLFTFQSVQAQMNYGVHASGSFETQAEPGQLWNNCEIYQGFLIGGFLDYSIGKNLSLQTELNYQKKGDKEKSTTDGIESVTRREFNYLTVPLLAKYKLTDAGLGDNWAITFFGGPYYSYLTSASENVQSGNETTPIAIDNQAENSDMGAIFGGGVTYRLKNGGAIIAELRYQMGLKSIDKQDPDLRNKGMGITIGYSF